MLFRNSHDSDLLEIELSRHNIPFVKYGGLKFLEAAHVKDLLSVLRWADNPRNELAAFRVLQLMEWHGAGERAAQSSMRSQRTADVSSALRCATRVPRQRRPSSGTRSPTCSIAQQYRDTVARPDAARTRVV